MADHIASIARKYGIDPNVFRALVGQESGGNQNAVSPKGAIGRTQLLPATAAALGVNPHDPIGNLVGGAKYLRQQLDHFGGDYHKALAAYNAGPGAVEKYNGVPPYAETQNYVRSILSKAGTPGRAPSSSSSSSTPRSRKVTTSRTIPGVDNSEARNALILNFLQQRHNPQAVVALASGLKDAQDTPSVKAYSSRTVKGSASSGGRVASGHSPVAGDGKIIGTPYQGTHTLGNWQSDNADDIAVPKGTPMVAVQDGVVVKVTKHPQGSGRFAGDQITIRGKNGNEYFYAHGVASVKPGQRVRKGQKLGVTGSANGVEHLHYGQKRGNPIMHARPGR